MTTKQGPNEFFDFDGLNAGIKISQIDKWPHNYTVSMWVCVESFDHHDKTRNQYYEPRLFWYVHENVGSCVTCYIASYPPMGVV